MIFGRRGREFATLGRDEARAFYDRFGEKQDRQAFYEEPVLSDLVAHASFEQARNVMEFGCGTGRFARTLLERHLPPDARYLGVDASATMVALARRHLGRFAGRALVLQTDGSPGIAAADRRFDRFLSTYVLDLLSPEDIAAVLREAHRTLVPAGLLCLVSLTWGTTPGARLVTCIWSALHHLRPSLVGGCRPLELRSLVREPDWRIRYVGHFAPYAIPSEILIAELRTSEGQSRAAQPARAS